MIKIRIKKSVKSKVKYGIIFIYVCCIFILLISNTSEMSKNVEIYQIKHSDYSDKLEWNEYVPITEVSNYYDGFDTFWYEEDGSFPAIRWTDSTGGGNVKVVEVSSHAKHMEIYDPSGSGTYGAYRWLDTHQNIHLTNIDWDNEKYYIQFWLMLDDNTGAYYPYFEVCFYREDGTTLTAGVKCVHDGGGWALWTAMENTGWTNSGKDISLNVWYFFEIEMERLDYDSLPPYILEHETTFRVDGLGTLKKYYDSDTQTADLEISKIEVKNAQGNYYYWIRFDALNIVHENGYNGNTKEYRTEIQNVICYDRVNYYVLDSNKLFCMYESIKDILPSFDNNYRQFFITDRIINTQYLNDNRSLRMIDSDTTDKKYKVVQLYFDDLNETESFEENLNQSVKIRVDSFDSSGILVNMYFLDIEFNNSIGLITWDALYKESSSVKRWDKTPTNPIFNFEDYIGQNANLTELELSIHFFLTYTTGNQMYLMIRTEVIFNNDLNQYYSYDKIIDAGNNTFYKTQSRLMVRYLDYFNENNCSDYLGNQFYTYNNLRGFRTLQLNSTDWINNFLDVGSFSSDLKFWESFSDPTPEPEPPDEPKQPPDSEYWTYESCTIQKKTTKTVVFQTTIPYNNETYQHNTTYNFDEVEGTTYTAKFYYWSKPIKERWLGNWKLDIKAKGSTINVFDANPVRNSIVFIFNRMLYWLQRTFFLCWSSLSYIITYIPCYWIVPVFWNIICYWVIYAFVFVGFWFVAGLIYLVGNLWFYILWFIEFMINVVIPFVVYYIIVPIMAFILALVFWVISMGQADFWELYNNFHSILTELADFMLGLTMEIFENLPAVLLYMVLYILFTFLLLFRYQVVRAKGLVRRTEECKIAFDVYYFPIQTVVNTVIKLKEIYARWT